MTDSSDEASKIIRPRSLKFMNQSKLSTDYELPSLRAKPRQKQNSANDNNNDIDSDNDSVNDSNTGGGSDSEHDELCDSDIDNSDDGSVFSMDEVEDVDNEEELPNSTRSRDRRRRRQQQQEKHDTSASLNTTPLKSTLRKRQSDDDEDSHDNRMEQATANSENTNNRHHPKRRKLRPNHTIRSSTIYNDLLSDDSDWMDQDIGIQYPSDMDLVMNERHGKSTATSPLVLGSPSKLAKSLGDSGQKHQQQPGDINSSSTLLSPDRINHSHQSSSTHGTSPSSKLDEKRWLRRPQASAFLDKLQAQQIDTLDLSQHSFIPQDFMELHHKTASAATENTPIGSHNTRTRKQTNFSLGKNDSGSDGMSDSDDMAYQYDFSTIGEPSSVVVDPSSDTISEDQDNTHTQQDSVDPPTPTPSFFRRIASFFFG